jgi:hypothetical protein
MTRKRMPALDFAGARLFEPFGRTLMGLQLWHLECPRVPVVENDLFEYTTAKYGRSPACHSPQQTTFPIIEHPIYGSN